MTEQYCPNCKEKCFTWGIDEEESPLTQWHCSNCKYYAWEDESKESNCGKCGTKNSMLLKSGSSYFYFCTNCQNKSEASPW